MSKVLCQKCKILLLLLGQLIISACQLPVGAFAGGAANDINGAVRIGIYQIFFCYLRLIRIPVGIGQRFVCLLYTSPSPRD